MWGGTKSDILTSRRGLDEAILEEDMKNQVDSLMEGHEIPGYQLNHKHGHNRVCIKVHLLSICTVSVQYFSIFLNVAVSSIFVIFDVLDILRDVGIDSLMANPTETHRYIGVSRVY